MSSAKSDHGTAAWCLHKSAGSIAGFHRERRYRRVGLCMICSSFRSCLPGAWGGPEGCDDLWADRCLTSRLLSACKAKEKSDAAASLSGDNIADGNSGKSFGELYRGCCEITVIRHIWDTICDHMIHILCINCVSQQLHQTCCAAEQRGI